MTACDARLTHGTRLPSFLLLIGVSRYRFERGIHSWKSFHIVIQFVFKFFYRFEGEIFRSLFHADCSPNCEASLPRSSLEIKQERCEKDTSALDQLPFQTRQASVARIIFYILKTARNVNEFEISGKIKYSIIRFSIKSEKL